MRKLLYKLTGWLVKKTNYALPIEPVTITPANMKRYHAQRLIPWHEWNGTYVIPVYSQQEFKNQIVNEFIKEIDINKEEVPEGVMMSCDLLFKSL